MQEESETFNKTENNSSDMILLPQNSHLEVLISDDEQMDTESRLDYDRKLSKKLKDLGFDEEGMTLQQKEELLAVVIASWETAEEEKSRRRIYEEYAEAAEVLSQREALSAATNQLPSSSKSNSTVEHASSKKNYSSQMQIFSPLELCETETIVTKFPYEAESSSSSQEREKKLVLQQKHRSKEGRGAKQSGKTPAVSTSTIQNVRKSTSNKKIKKKNLEKCTSLWRPCLSPKDAELSNSRFSSNENITTRGSYSTPPDDYYTSMAQVIEDLDFAMLRLGESHPETQTSLPFHLARHNHFAKRPNRTDKIDLMLGSPEKEDAAPQEVRSNPLQKIEPLRTSGALRTLKKDGKLKTNSDSSMTTRSGAHYSPSAGSKRHLLKKDHQQTKRNVEEKPNNQESPNVTDNEVEVILEERLPRFTKIQPTHIQAEDTGKSISAELCTYPSTSKSTCSTQNFKNDIHVVNSSSRDSDSSGTSSVIDVETIVDDEIEEFVLKRKRMQQNHITNKQNRVNRSKRFKKNIS